MHRRHALKLGAYAALALSPAARLLARDRSRGFPIGACDWSIGRSQQLAALALAKEIGLDGVQVSFGEKGVRYDLRNPDVRQEYADACEKLNVRIASLAMGVLNSRPYASDADAEQWVADCIDVMAVMNQKVVLLAFFGNGDIKDNPAAQQHVISRLKKVAPRAERAGVVLGVESWLNADEHLRILDAVGSPAVQVYYDVANMEMRGYDIYKEIRQLGRERICEVHAKENDSLLGQGKVDFPKVKEALDDIGWTGWLIIESANPAGRSVVENYKLNRQYLRSVFPA
ncbi:MAG: sugar phosphate isomerase/epimerase [Planctomycetes bacterium]|nr:sugar phosphate isomerase/epimerase [Planctomycetota bacterium]